MSKWIHRPEQYAVSEPVHVPALWSSPWEPSPSSLGEQAAHRKWPSGTDLLLRTLGVCWHWRAFFFFFSHWNIYHHNLSPLDQLYTCHVLWQWIINMSVISISSIDFCHSFEMDMLVLSLSLSVSSKNSWPQRTLQTYAAFPCHSVRCTPSLLMVFLQYVMVLLLTIFMMQLMIDWWITWSLKWHKYQKISMTPFRRWIEKPKHLRRTTILDK